MELWENANKALEELLATKESTDTHWWRAIWELGMELCQNKSQAAESIKEAKAVSSWVTLDAQTKCSQLTLDAKTTCSWVTLDAKPPSQWQSKKPRCPKTVSSERSKLLTLQPSEMSRPGGPPGQSHSKGNMATLCGIWRCKSSERRAEVKLTSSLPARPLCTPAHQSSRVFCLCATTFYWGRHLHHLHSSYCRGLPQWKNSLLLLFLPHQCPSSLRPKR